MALLSGTRNHRHSALSQKIFDRMKLLFPNKKQALISGSILLANTYLSVGDDQQAKEIQLTRVQQLGRKVKIGMSRTEVNGEIVVQVFYTSKKI